MDEGVRLCGRGCECVDEGVIVCWRGCESVWARV